MGRPNKIRLAAKEGVVRKLAAAGLGYREIADELKAKHGVDVSHAAVGRFLQEDTEERKAAARSVAAQNAQSTIALTTKAARELMDMNMEAAARASLEGDIRALAVASTAAVAAIKTLHALSMGEKPTSEMDGLHDRIQEILKVKRKG